MKYIIAHDVGTQSSKAVLIGTDGKIYKSSEQNYPIYYPKPGWVEQDPEDYWQAVCDTTKQITAGLENVHDILAMVFSTQAMGIIPVDQSGNVLYRNISWVDSRAGIQADQIMRRFMGQRVFKGLTGVRLSGKDVIPKLLWLKENVPEIYRNTYKILDVNGYLKFKCTGKMLAEWSGACSYGFNLEKKDWERLFFKIAGFDTNKLPELVRSIDFVGTLTARAAKELGLPENVKIFGGSDDTQSAALGSGRIDDGDAHIYLGSSAWIGISTHKNHKFKNGIASLQSADPDSALLVGITESAGVNIEWALDLLYRDVENKERYALMEEEVKKIAPGSNGLIITPWFLGERTPVTDINLRSTFFNLELQHTRAHILRAMLEGVGYNLKWTIENIEKDYEIRFDEITVIGGGSKNETWMQSLSDILQKRIHITKNPKMAGAMGSAMIALVGLGLDMDFSKIKKINPEAKTFEPREMYTDSYQKLFAQYKSMYYSLKKNYRQANKERFNQN